MRIGIPKEIKSLEQRVVLTPQACAALVEKEHDVFVEKNAGKGSGFADSAYIDAGAQIMPDAKALYENAELIVKVKEPQPEEWAYLRPDHLLFGYLHLAAEPALAQELQKIGLTAIAFETVRGDAENTTPLLAPMSAVAGRLAIQLGTHFLYEPQGGKGQLLGGIQKSSVGHALIIGAGVAGQEAAHLAYRLGAKVTLLDINEERLEMMGARYPNMVCEKSTPEAISALLPTVDLLVGAVYVFGKKAPHVVTEEQVKMMQKGSVIVDISIDQGGCIATSEPCSHSDPLRIKHGVSHLAITNLPSAVPLAASQVLSDAVLPYVKNLAAGVWSDALKKGINVEKGDLLIDL